jgi:hypothetical protein
LRTEIVAVVLVLIVLFSASFGYFVGAANQKTVTSTSATTYTRVSTTTVSTGMSVTTATVASVQLIAIISPGTIASGGNVTISAEVYNPLPTNATLVATVLVSPTESACGYVDAPIGIQVYNGHYDFSNLSTSTPLTLYNATGPPPPCPPPPLNPVVFTFLPNSDQALVSASTPPVQAMSRTVVLSGYWAPSLVAGPGGGGYYHQPFNPGAYTVLIFDAWGQQTLEYFHVSTPAP